MSRVKKLLIVGLVLAVGTGLAWPFRKTGSLENTAQPSPISPLPTYESLASDGGLTDPLPSPHPLPREDPGPRHVVAKMASTGDSTITPTRELGDTSFDLANHPALSHRPIVNSPEAISPTASQKPRARQTEAGSRPAYATAEVAPEQERLLEVVHVVRNTDTLEKLAKRYLGDKGRALEIFDLNREQLSNPHLLPIGAKLRIPARPVRESD